MRRKGVDEAWTALEEMQRQGVTTDKYTVSRMLMKTVGDNRSRTNAQRIYRGIGLVERFIEAQPKDVDEVLFNALLDTCCRLKDLARLEATVKRMRELNVQPSPVTLGILVKTYGQAGDLQKVLQVWSEMEKQRGQANAVTYGCMIDACVKCGHLGKAVENFKGLREAGKHKNRIVYTSLIKGYGLEKDLPHALELFREMATEGVPYNAITYNSILEACIKCNDLPAAEGLLREMMAPSSSMEPDLITFSTLLKGYCHVGDLDKALQVLEAIKARGLRCDELVYNTLMDGCVKASDVAAGVGLFEEMVAAGLRPSSITHSILVRLYQRASPEEDANEVVAQLYQHHGIDRPSGGDGRRSSSGADARGFGSRLGAKSPGGNKWADRRTPHGSPSSSMRRATSGADCSEAGWGGCGVECASASGELATPLSTSPMCGGQAYLPFEALRHSPMIPPLPIMSREATPFGAQSRTPAGSPVPHSSPYGSPMSTFSQADMFSVPASPQTMAHQMQMGFCGPMAPQQQQVFHPVHGAAPQLPPWPFACTMPAPQANGAQMMPGGAVAPAGDMQFIAVPLMPGATAPAPALQGMVGQQPQQAAAYFEGWGQGMGMPGVQSMPQGSFFG